MTTLKEQKEAFVTGFEGTSPWELFLIASTAPMGLFFYRTMVSSSSPSLLMEAIAFWVSMILCQSTFLYPYGVLYLSLELFMAVVTMHYWQSSSHRNAPSSPLVLPTTLTVYRSSLLYLTFVAILAVDFPVFPRRWVKTETHGYSWMDLGAASFVVAAGLVSPRARSRNHNTTRIKLQRTVPLLTLGFVRLVTHKGLEYQEHVSEYGIHWNFFFTLAMVTPLTWMIPIGWWIPTLVMTIYQALLSVYDLQEWVETAPRVCSYKYDDDLRLCRLVVANREGLLGCLGYSSLYLYSEWIATICLWKKETSLAVMSGVCVGVWTLLVSLGVTTSRRTTNVSFVAWVLAFNLVLLTAIQTVMEHTTTTTTSAANPPRVLNAVNRHGLILFVVANLLTGFVNLSINTLQVADRAALAILFVYMWSISMVALGLDRLRGTKSKAV